MNYCQLTDNKYLKSNMDRFIANKPIIFKMAYLHLKSNMDRFIEKMIYEFSCAYKI